MASASQSFQVVFKIQGLHAFPNHCKNGRFGTRFEHFCVFCGVGYTKLQMYGNVGLNTFSFTDLKMLAWRLLCALANQSFQNSLESQGLDPLQKRTVWSSFLNTFCVLWGGVHRTSNVRKCRSNNIQLYRLNFGLKGFLDSSQPDVSVCFEIPWPILKQI